MVSPAYTGSPSRYEPNPTDDRAIKDPDQSSAYLQIAVAIEAIEDIPAATYRQLNRGTRQGLRTAESALRRAAFSLVIHAQEES